MGASDYRAVIGLECHAQLRTATKMFCRCPAPLEHEELADRAPNSAVCPICLGHPGVLPVVNAAAIALAVRAARALGAQIHPRSEFARKHYFYPDLPKGYQISQFDRPLATGGHLHIPGPPGSEGPRAFGITRLHLEEDAGRMIHEPQGAGSEVDWNRAGLPLIEIVGEPDIESPEQAEQWLRMLHRVLRESGVCTGSMERGHLRCDANISLHRAGEPWGAKVEIKNINSFRNVARALRFEIERQQALLKAGEPTRQETRAWNGKGTVLLRSKEQASDYRYFPEPDLPPLLLDDHEISAQDSALVGLPLDLHLMERDRSMLQAWRDQYGLDNYVVGVLSSEPSVAAFFGECVALGGEPRAMANWIQNDLLRLLKLSAAEGRTLEDSPLKARHLVALQGSLAEGAIPMSSAREILEELFFRGGEPETLIRERGVARLDDAAQLREQLREIIARSPAQVARYRSGNTNMLGYFMGQLMKSTGGRADPRLAQRLVQEALDPDEPASAG